MRDQNSLVHTDLLDTDHQDLTKSVKSKIYDLGLTIALSYENGDTVDLKQIVRDLEKQVITNTLIVTQNNQSLTARVLGISRANLISKLKQYEEEKRSVNNRRYTTEL